MSNIGHLWIPVRNLKESVSFYTEKLGFKSSFPLEEGQEEEGDQLNLENDEAFNMMKSTIKDPSVLEQIKNFRSTKLESADKNVVLFLIEQPESRLTPNILSIIPGIKVSDLQKAMQTLSARGVVFAGDVIPLDDRKVVFLVDPNRHLLQLYELTEETA